MTGKRKSTYRIDEYLCFILFSPEKGKRFWSFNYRRVMFEIALVDCKVLGIVRTLVEGSSARKAIELRPGEIWPDSCHSRTTQSHLTFNLTGGVLWGESTPVRPYWCGPFLPIGISGFKDWMTSKGGNRGFHHFFYIRNSSFSGDEVAAFGTVSC